jgi:hypothetical protein
MTRMNQDSNLSPEVERWMDFVLEDEDRIARIAVERIVCPVCRGRGSSSAYLGDVTEWLREDPDAVEDYVGGFYDRECDECHGLRVIDEPVEAGSDPADWARLMAWLRDAADHRREIAAERRMGA